MDTENTSMLLNALLPCVALSFYFGCSNVFSLCNIVFFLFGCLLKSYRYLTVFLVCAECFGAQSNLSCLVFLQCFSGWVVNVQWCVCVLCVCR